MTKLTSKITNPMTVIAIFATLSETSAAISLPFLDNKDREIYIWFLISFPFYLLLLFFVTLNFNYRSLYAPSDFEKGKHFLKALDNTEPSENNDPAVSRENTKRHKPTDDRRSTSPSCPPQTPTAGPGVQQRIQQAEVLNDLCIIDARWLGKKTQFSALLEKIQKPQERQTHIILFLTCAESETALKESAFKHSSQARKHDKAAFYAAYNLNSHEVTVIDQSDQR